MYASFYLVLQNILVLHIRIYVHKCQNYVDKFFVILTRLYFLKIKHLFNALHIIEE